MMRIDVYCRRIVLRIVETCLQLAEIKLQFVTQSNQYYTACAPRASSDNFIKILELARLPLPLGS
jgi:hypothetical protein